jgi:hypothetical protein
MGDPQFKNDLEVRRKKHRENFSNYENAVTLISSLEAWFEYRWGLRGTESAGLLEYFNRFPFVDDLTPDFEVKFHTPYILWGDHKRTIQPPGKGTDDVAQIIKYASRRPEMCANLPTAATSEPAVLPVAIPYDVVVLVRPENDDAAAGSIDLARQAYLSTSIRGEEQQSLARIIVLGCYLDRESINKEWYNLKWRGHYNNQKFSSPNISTDSSLADLNALIADATHHPIPVTKPALDLAGRSPFMNDTPPAIYTAIRLVVPALNLLLSDTERDTLQSTGKVEKVVARDDIMGTDFVTSMNPRPRKLCKWIDGALEFMVTDLSCAKRVADTSPQQYKVVVDTTLLRSDPRELWSERAAIKAAKQAAKRSGRSRSRGSNQNQLRLFD